MKLLLFTLVLLSACTHKSFEKVPSEYLINGTRTTAFTYKGHEYLSNYHGGIIHSASCPCNFK